MEELVNWLRSISRRRRRSSGWILIGMYVRLDWNGEGLKATLIWRERSRKRAWLSSLNGRAVLQPNGQPISLWSCDDVSGP